MESSHGLKVGKARDLVFKYPTLFFSMVYLVLSIIVFNWYPFNAASPLWHSALLLHPLAFKLYLFSLSLYMLLSSSMMLMIPLGYVSKKIGVWRRKPYLYSIGVGAVLFFLLNMMGVPVYVSPSLELIERTMGLAVVGVFASVVYLLLFNVFYGVILFLLMSTLVYGSAAKGLARLGLGALIKSGVIVFVVWIIMNFLGGIINLAIIVATKCVLCDKLYLRGYHPEVIRRILEKGSKVSYADSPTWGELISSIMLSIIAGIIIFRYFKKDLRKNLGDNVS